MKKQLSRRDFLKIGGSAVFSAALLGYGSQKLLELLENSEAPIVSGDSPNVILMVLDTVRAESMSLYGYERPTTPNLKKFSEQAVFFKNAFSNGTWTLPSHASMFTARYPHQVNVDWNTPLDRTHPVLAELFSMLGYQTAGFIANLNYCSYEFGLNRGFTHYEDYLVSPGQTLLSSPGLRNIYYHTNLDDLISRNDNFGRKSAEQVNYEFLSWHERRNPDRPFFVFLNYYDAHDPYLPPGQYAHLYRKERAFGHPDRLDPLNPDPTKLAVITDAYDSAITYLDDQIGILLQELKSRDILKNTLLIITSDHGEHIGDHQLIGHGNSVYQQLVKIPLLLYFDGVIPKMQTIESAVSLIDIPMTVIDLLGLENLTNFSGKSLRRSWTDRPSDELIYSEVHVGKGKNRETYGLGWFKSLILKDMHYIQYPNQKEELFNYIDDPREVDNQVESSHHADLVAEFRSSLKNFYP